MAKPVHSDEYFIETFRKFGGTRTSDILHISLRSVLRRRRRLEKEIGEPINPPNANSAPGRLNIDLNDGVIIIFSDCHYWPDMVPVMHRALIHFCKKLRPDYVIANGDICDFAGLSRFDPIGWENRPSVIDEIETCQMRLEEVRKATSKAKHIWTAGNHDIRFESKLAKHLPDMAKVKGVHLRDHFPKWQTTWSAWFNGDLVVKHRIKGGANAVRNNVIATGKHVATGHLHSAKVVPVSAYGETLWGIDCGTLADCFGPQFMYAEDNPRDWRSGFGILTIRGGMLMQPELVLKVDDNRVEYQNKLVDV